MTAGEPGLTILWRDIDALLARARAARPLHRADPLLDLDQLSGCGEIPLLERLARATEGWEGRLVLTATDDSLAPDILVGDRLVVDMAIEGRDGDLVLAYTEGALIVRRLCARGGQPWPVAREGAPLALGPLVAIIGVVVELRRAIPPHASQRVAGVAPATPSPVIPP
jgi:hypothetical protein